ncbi:MAG TPA: zinc ribbon domain-containing protein [Candidatus Methanoperedens sp.]|nr:zinc ribbon domain-containing protein [Candidatus Methanoperedens sp.]
MECRACAVVNDPGRRYCRACGGRLGQWCTVCHFFNALDDRHCGGCGRRLAASPGGAAADGALPAAYAPAIVDDLGFEAGDRTASQPAIAAGVSPSEIDGLFESILDEEPGEGCG